MYRCISLVFCVCFMTNYASAQDTNSFVRLNPVTSFALLREPARATSDNTILTITPEDDFFAFSYMQTSAFNFWHVVYRGNVGWVWDNYAYCLYDETEKRKLADIGMNDDSIRMRRAIVLDAAAMKYFKVQRDIDSMEKVKDSLEAEMKLAKARQQGLGIYSFDYDYANEYSSFVDINIGVFNFSKKTIKYVYFFFSAEDAVGGKISSFGKTIFTAKGVGPIEANDGGYYEFDNLIYSKIVDYVYAVKIDVEYMDGTKKSFPKPIRLRLKSSG